MTNLSRIILATGLALSSVSNAIAAQINWVDWTESGNNTVSGTLQVGTNTVDVTFNGPYYFAQMSGGTNYWDPSTPYTSAVVDNPPPASDIIALAGGGTKTITFSAAVQDPLIALASWNTNTVDFGVPIQILSFGHGYWGNGTPILNGSGTGFYGDGEVHGVIRLLGSFTSITFTDTTELWHGLSIGVVATPSNPSNVPEPASLALLGLGLAGLAVGRRRKAD